MIRQKATCAMVNPNPSVCGTVHLLQAVCFNRTRAGAGGASL